MPLLSLRHPLAAAATFCALGAALDAAPLAAQHTAADSALVARILLAEDRHDTTDVALRLGANHRDALIRSLAERARARIVDPVFAQRDSLSGPAFGPFATSRTWPEPEWKTRYRALAAQRDDCGAMLVALQDAEPAVRLRAADLVRESCAANVRIIGRLGSWLTETNAPTASAAATLTWHGRAHAIVALARLQPEMARGYLPTASRDSDWHVRQRAARAAGIVGDTNTLRALTLDEHGNVIEAATEGLARLTGHASDSIYLRLLDDARAQVVRAAATALAGSRDPRTAPEAMRTFERFVERGNASERDVRVALLAAAGRPESEDRPPTRPDAEHLLPDAVALALGAERHLEVRLAAAAGGERTFAVRLRGDVAPLMAAQVLRLARNGYYDGTDWHRAELDFVLQGGSPDANEYVGYSRVLRDELSTLPHARGTIGMSTRGHDTGDAQWFINLRDNLRLGRDYTVFAEVVRGMDVVDELLEGDRIVSIREISPSERPTRP